ncbi:AcrR family transcriptional regulator [Pseudarthrobacter siccitolerans]|uniref:AcrR family transcriptional regulator n=1 Tax=Pseudarthrobacter siccitolerans TaxID=861266 RepID=A0ABU0PL49_9MICC|nr:TetR/AcrR family transcriptional regulator [Pseudarthrobacter siccitolerans]MDQ0674694.1 AcrR family transcriptional regulator [Pseudarthrobacter siccitolerans]
MSNSTALLGRPRDPAIDRRINEAALSVYAAQGWQAMTMDAIAKDAGVGKSALYRRWPNKGKLLIDAMLTLEVIQDVDTGNLREDLLILARQFADMYFGPTSMTYLRFQVEARLIPELQEVGEDYVRRQVLAGRSIIRRAIARGELPVETSPTVPMAMLYGAIMTHSFSYPQQLDERVRRNLPLFLEDLVDSVIAGANRSRHQGDDGSKLAPGSQL